MDESRAGTLLRSYSRLVAQCDPRSTLRYPHGSSRGVLQLLSHVVRLPLHVDILSPLSCRSEHMDELAHIPPPHIRNLLVDCYTRHDITTTNGPTSAVVDMVQDIMVEEEDTQDVVEDKDVVGRVDDVLDVHLSLVMYLLVFLTTSLWSLSLLVGGLLWPVGISTKTKVVPIPSVDLLCEDQRSRDTSDPKKDHSTMWGEAKDDPASVGSV
ncbi:hypothetical protein AC1031_009320 [Aphanomyces cochlioides]|nr:hypothetical protein AC1031_009320 [Aphanomyces cochlioides]